MTRWGPLVVEQGVLTVRRRASFTPGGLVAGGETFGWDDVGGFPVDPELWPGGPASGWALSTVVDHRWLRARLRLAVAVYASPSYGLPERSVDLGGWAEYLNDRALTAVLALSAFLRDEPRARAGLADPVRVLALLAALRPKPREHLPHEPLLGDAHDLHWAVIRGYRAAVPRRYADRRVDTDPPPALDRVVAAARLALRPALRERFTDDEIAERARPYVERFPWPFAELL